MKLRSLHIEDYKLFKDFNIDFLDSDDKPLPIVILAGVNGSGKTTLLEYIDNFVAYLESKRVPLGSDFIEFNARIHQEKGLVPANQIPFTNHTININNFKEYPFNNFKEYREIYKEDIVYFPVNKNNMLDLKESILRRYRLLARKSSHLEALENIQKFIATIFEGLEINLTISDINDIDRTNELVTFENSSGNTFEIEALSTGEKTLFSKALYLYFKDYKEKVILIDEPELSLHPSWQNRVLKIYENFAKISDCQIIIATHSPHIITSADNESIRFLEKNEEGNITVIKDIQAYGRDMEWVLQQMGVKNLRVSEVLEKFTHCQQLLNDEKYDEAEKAIDELENIIGENDKEILALRNDLAFERIDFEEDN